MKNRWLHRGLRSDERKIRPNAGRGGDIPSGFIHIGIWICRLHKKAIEWKSFRDLHAEWSKKSAQGGRELANGVRDERIEEIPSIVRCFSRERPQNRKIPHSPCIFYN
jgi:hypothetical protein